MMTLPTPLITATELAALLAAQAPTRLFDISFDLTDPSAGQRAFDAAHLPGARHLDLNRDLADHAPPTPGRPRGRHPLPERETFAALLGGLGVDESTAVVLYDRSGGMFAARAWWMLRWLGHREVAVLDGGWSAWLATGGASETVAPGPVEPRTYHPGQALVTQIDADALQRDLGRLCLVDARAPERFRGEVEPLDPVAGHIPGALNRPFKDNLDAAGRFLPAPQLHAAFAALLGGRPAGEVVHQCGSGVSACHNLLAMEAAGLTGAALYPGSWSEWCADPARPVARG